jgi:hypothetical protein
VKVYRVTGVNSKRGFLVDRYRLSMMLKYSPRRFSKIEEAEVGEFTDVTAEEIARGDVLASQIR